MAAKGMSWKDKYEHTFWTFAPLWNSALKWIAETYGPEALDKYLADSYGLPEFGWAAGQTLPVTREDVVRDGAAWYGRVLVKHLLLVGHDGVLVKDDPDESIVLDRKCASKAMLIEKHQDPTYWCRHCQMLYSLPFWEKDLGLKCEVKLTGKLSCQKTYRKVR